MEIQAYVNNNKCNTCSKTTTTTPYSQPTNKCYPNHSNMQQQVKVFGYNWKFMPHGTRCVASQQKRRGRKLKQCPTNKQTKQVLSQPQPKH